jgi:hypothetical protein
MDPPLHIAHNGRMAPLRALLILALLAAPGLCQAATRRIAVVVGSNAGNPGRRPLRYAENDARKFARVMQELGGIDGDDLLLLQGGSALEIERAFALLTARTTALHRDPSTHVVLLFYFSGHSDGAALELGADRLGFGDLRRLLAQSGAEVKVAIVDACQSGALLSTKGGSAGPGFHVSLADDEGARGSVFLTSSAGSEYALESAEVQGSYFTHHLVSGLRGAADRSGDGRVTLAEAYQYAFDRTVAATAATAVGPQHPAFDYALSGQGELVLTDLRDRPTAALVLPEGLERALVVDLAHDQVVAEVGPAAPPRVTVSPGRYGLRIWRARHSLGEEVELRQGEERRVRWSDLHPEAFTVVAAKGDALPDEVSIDGHLPRARDEEGSVALLVAAGVSRGLEDAVGGNVGFRAGLENAHASGLGLAFVGGVGRAPHARELDLTLHLQLRVGGDLGRARLFLALEAGPGFVEGARQDVAFSGPLVQLGPRAGLRFGVTPRVRVTLELDGFASASYYLGHVQSAFIPSATAGLELAVF